MVASREAIGRAGLVAERKCEVFALYSSNHALERAGSAIALLLLRPLSSPDPFNSGCGPASSWSTSGRTAPSESSRRLPSRIVLKRSRFLRSLSLPLDEHMLLLPPPLFESSESASLLSHCASAGCCCWCSFRFISSCCCFSRLMREWRFLMLSSDCRSLSLASSDRRTSAVSELSISSKSIPLCSLSSIDFSNSSKCCSEMRFSASRKSDMSVPVPVPVPVVAVVGSRRIWTSKSSVSSSSSMSAAGSAVPTTSWVMFRRSCSRLRLRRTIVRPSPLVGVVFCVSGPIGDRSSSSGATFARADGPWKGVDCTSIDCGSAAGPAPPPTTVGRSGLSNGRWRTSSSPPINVPLRGRRLKVRSNGTAGGGVIEGSTVSSVRLINRTSSFSSLLSVRLLTNVPCPLAAPPICSSPTMPKVLFMTACLSRTGFGATNVCPAAGSTTVVSASTCGTSSNVWFNDERGLRYVLKLRGRRASYVPPPFSSSLPASSRSASASCSSTGTTNVSLGAVTPVVMVVLISSFPASRSSSVGAPVDAGGGGELSSSNEDLPPTSAPVRPLLSLLVIFSFAEYSIEFMIEQGGDTSCSQLRCISSRLPVVELARADGVARAEGVTGPPICTFSSGDPPLGNWKDCEKAN
uniref:Uncharacterized protein n=1 Tax=Anopheles merus TaxID=30066 RepID=A0A182V4S5_ANOME